LPALVRSLVTILLFEVQDKSGVLGGFKKGTQVGDEGMHLIDFHR
jgi:hypothetical protein